MSTYAVFGMTPSRAEALARKVTSWYKGKELITPTEFEERVSERTAKILDSKRTVQLSTFYDAPQFAGEYLELAKKSGGVRLSVKARVKKKDKSGRFEFTRTGSIKREWVSVSSW